MTKYKDLVIGAIGFTFILLCARVIFMPCKFDISPRLFQVSGSAGSATGDYEVNARGIQRYIARFIDKKVS